MPYIGMEKQFEQPVKYHENAEKSVKGKYKQGQSIATLNLSGLTSIDDLGKENFLKRNKKPSMNVFRNRRACCMLP